MTTRRCHGLNTLRFSMGLGGLLLGPWACLPPAEESRPDEPMGTLLTAQTERLDGVPSPLGFANPSGFAAAPALAPFATYRDCQDLPGTAGNHADPVRYKYRVRWEGGVLQVARTTLSISHAPPRIVDGGSVFRVSLSTGELTHDREKFFPGLHGQGRFAFGSQLATLRQWVAITASGNGNCQVSNTARTPEPLGEVLRYLDALRDANTSLFVGEELQERAANRACHSTDSRALPLSVRVGAHRFEVTLAPGTPQAMTYSMNAEGRGSIGWLTTTPLRGHLTRRPEVGDDNREYLRVATRVRGFLEGAALGVGCSGGEPALSEAVEVLDDEIKNASALPPGTLFTEAGRFFSASVGPQCDDGAALFVIPSKKELLVRRESADGFRLAMDRATGDIVGSVGNQGLSPLGADERWAPPQSGGDPAEYRKRLETMPSAAQTLRSELLAGTCFEPRCPRSG